MKTVPEQMNKSKAVKIQLHQYGTMVLHLCKVSEWEENSVRQYRLMIDHLKRCSIEKDLGMLMGKFTMSQQRALMAK